MAELGPATPASMLTWSPVSLFFFSFKKAKKNLGLPSWTLHFPAQMEAPD